MVTLVVILTWALLAYIFKIPSWISFFAGISALLVSFISLVFEHLGFGLRGTIYAFGFFVIALACYFKESVGNEKK